MHQPPVYSPVTLAGTIRAGCACLAGRGAGARRALGDLLVAGFTAESVALCGSGTQSLQLALRVAQESVGASSLVALPAYTCFDVASAAVGAEVQSTFYDLDPETLSPDLDSVRQSIARGARVIVVAPLFGYGVAWDELRRLASESGTLVVEDAAQGAGASVGGRRFGSLGDLSVISFGRGKGWTGGAGGALLARSELGPVLQRISSYGLASRLENFRVGAKVLAQWSFGGPRLYAVPSRIPWLGLGETSYHPPKPLRSISSFSASMVLETESASSTEHHARRATAAKLVERIRGAAVERALVTLVRPTGGSEPGYLRLPLLVRDIESRGLATPGARRLGIMPGYPRILPQLEQLRTADEHRSSEYPGAKQLVRELVTLPTHRFISSKVIDALIDALSLDLAAR